MQQKIVFGVAIVFIAIGILSLYLYQQQESQPLEEEYEPDFGVVPTAEEGAGSGSAAPTLGNCPNLDSQYDKDLCWSFQAGAEQNVRLCDNIQGESRKVICIEAVARELLDKGICDQEFPSNQDRRYHCITQVARDDLDFTLCDSMPQPYKDKCVSAVEDEEGMQFPGPFPE